MPPGSGSVSGVAVFSKSIVGRTSTMVKVALSLSVTTLPSLSSPVAVTVSVSLSPTLPVSVLSMEQVYEPPDVIVWGTRQSPWPSRSPRMLSSSAVRVSPSTDESLVTTMTMS